MGWELVYVWFSSFPVAFIWASWIQPSKRTADPDLRITAFVPCPEVFFPKKKNQQLLNLCLTHFPVYDKNLVEAITKTVKKLNLLKILDIFIHPCLPLDPLNSYLPYLLKPLAVFHSFPQHLAGSLDSVLCLSLLAFWLPLLLWLSLRNHYGLAAHGPGPRDAIWKSYQGCGPYPTQTKSPFALQGVPTMSNQGF